MTIGLGYRAALEMRSYSFTLISKTPNGNVDTKVIKLSTVISSGQVFYNTHMSLVND